MPILDQYAEPQDDTEEAWVQIRYGDHTTQESRGGNVYYIGSVIIDCYAQQSNPDRTDYLIKAAVSAVAQHVNDDSEAQFVAATIANSPRLQGWEGLRATIPYWTTL